MVNKLSWAIYERGDDIGVRDGRVVGRIEKKGGGGKGKKRKQATSVNPHAPRYDCFFYFSIWAKSVGVGYKYGQASRMK
jgi:hypothetical protein